MFDLTHVTLEFIANLSDMMVLVITSTDEVAFANNQARALFGASLSGKNLSAMLTADELSFLRHNLHIAVYQNKRYDFYWLLRNRFYTVAAVPHQQLIFLSMRDITEIKTQSDVLSECSARLNRIEHLANLGYWEFYLADKTFYWSDGMYRLFDIKDKQKNYHYNLLRRHIHPDDIEVYRQKLRSLLKENHNVSGNIRLLTDNAEVKYCRFVAARGNNMTAYGIIQDITEYCRSNAYLAAATLGHDIKQHLQAIKMFNTADVGDTTDSLAQKSHNINVQIERISQLLNDTAAQAQNFHSLVFQQNQSDNQLAAICSDFHHLSAIRHIRLICRIRPLDFAGDWRLLSQILRNLLDNAFKFARTKVIFANNRHSIWIADDGQGIAPEFQTQVFERFYRGSTQSGWGLGLYTVKENAKHLGAKITLKSRLGCYSIFRLNLSVKESLSKSKICVNNESLTN